MCESNSNLDLFKRYRHDNWNCPDEFMLHLIDGLLIEFFLWRFIYEKADGAISALVLSFLRGC